MLNMTLATGMKMFKVWLEAQEYKGTRLLDYAAELPNGWLLTVPIGDMKGLFLTVPGNNLDDHCVPGCPHEKAFTDFGWALSLSDAGYAVEVASSVSAAMAITHNYLNPTPCEGLTANIIRFPDLSDPCRTG